MGREPRWGSRVGWPVGSLAGCLCVAAALAGLPWALRYGLWLPAASAVVATLVLGLVAERVLARKRVTAGAGALAGTTVALLAHPGMVLVLGAAVAPGLEFDSATDLAGCVVGLTVLSLFYWGWVTLPLGCLAGCTAGALVRCHHGRCH